MSRDFYIITLFKSNKKDRRDGQRKEDQKSRSQKQTGAELSSRYTHRSELKESEETSEVKRR